MHTNQQSRNFINQENLIVTVRRTTVFERTYLFIKFYISVTKGVYFEHYFHSRLLYVLISPSSLLLLLYGVLPPRREHNLF